MTSGLVMESTDSLSLLIEQCKSMKGRDDVRENGALRKLCIDLNALRQDRKCYVLALRALRNACAGSLINVHVLVEHNILAEIYEFLTFLRDMEPPGDDLEFHEEKKSIVTASYQLLANVCNCGEVGAYSFWTYFGTEGLTHLLALAVAVKSPDAVGAALAAVHACLVHEPGGQTTCTTQLLQCKGRSIVRHGVSKGVYGCR